jgi:predicted ATPase/DNA-binding CsgD family transcriptional regulator
MTTPRSPDPISAYASIGTLPLSATPLLGRSREVAAVRAVLDAGDVRLVTLTGAGGIGKTRLALEVAGTLEGHFAYGARFVPLAAVRDAGLVPATVAQTLDVRPEGGVSPTAALIEVLRPRHLLLVLDNLEHLAQGLAPLIAELLAACPRLHLLATSRVPLRIAAEQQYPLEPLSLPERTTDITLERIAQSSAVQLFVQRVQAARPDFTLRRDLAEDVAEICRLLDGVPLAIELAAARVPILSPMELRQRLSSRLPLLTGNRMDAPPRHRTMRDAIAWSYDLLPEADQRALRQLSVFAGGFTLDAAEAVTEDVCRSVPIVDLLGSLVDHSLLRVVADAHGRDRFRQLETIREYGLERLVESGEERAARDQHAAYFQQLVSALHLAVAEAEPADRGGRLVHLLDRLEAERHNLRAALTWLQRQERIEEAMELAVAIWPFRTNHGYDVEARATIEELLDQTSASRHSVARADALHAACNLARRQGDPLRAMEVGKEALAIYRALDDPGCAGEVLLSLGWVLLDLGRLDEALGHYRESYRLAQAVGNLEAVAAALDMMGLLYVERNDLGAAASCLQQALRISRTEGDRGRLGQVLGHLGVLALRQRKTDLASDYLRESMAIAREIRDEHLLSMGVTFFAETLYRHGDLDAAESLLAEDLAACRTTGYAHGIAMTLANLGCLAIDRRNPEEALRLLRESVVAFQRIGLRYASQYGATMCFDAFACLAFELDALPSAARFIGMADALLDRDGLARPDGDPLFIDQRRLDALRSALESVELDAEWQAGHALSEDAMVEAALAFTLPPTISPSIPQDVTFGNESGLTPRELDVLRLMADGLTNQQIADALFVSQRTVASHAASITGKLGVSTRTGAVAHAIRHGLA